MSVKMPSELAVVGLGYVGLPLASAFGHIMPTLGFDINPSRIQELKKNYDRNGELTEKGALGPKLSLTHDARALCKADFLIVAVPTPVDKAKRPDLSYLTEASRLVGEALRIRRYDFGETDPPPVVVYESTTFPGCTEEVCIPVIERASGLKAGTDFKVGYSPERINPGDREHTLSSVIKIIAAQDVKTLDLIASVYSLVVKAGLYRAPNIRTAEAAKIIENVQRDINIALMNELSMLFHCIDIDFREVLQAARTKWNFLPFKPGLVGGHCIPEDPYYLSYKAQEAGYHPEIILAGRRINDTMGSYVAQQTVKQLIKAGKSVPGAKVLVLGVSFKENVKDVRSTRVVPLVRDLEEYQCRVDVYDPVVGETTVRSLGLTWAADPFASSQKYDAVVLAVPHDCLIKSGTLGLVALLSSNESSGVLIDVKGVLDLNGESTHGPVRHWTL